MVVGGGGWLAGVQRHLSDQPKALAQVKADQNYTKMKKRSKGIKAEKEVQKDKIQYYTKFIYIGTLH